MEEKIDWNAKKSQKKETKPKIDQKIVDGVRKKIYSSNEYKFIETQTRNVLLVGRTRSGKSTTLGVLKDPCYIPETDTIFSETVEPSFRSFSLQNVTENSTQEITLNIIDTPGLFEIKDIQTGGERTNEVIAQTISKCLEHEITNINVIIMFGTFEAGINRDDIKAMEIFLDMFGGSNVKIALCITHADKHDDDWQEMRRLELNKLKLMKELIEKENMAILFMGCVGKSYINVNSDQDLLELYMRIYLMRREMLQMIFSAENRVQLVQMNIAKTKIKFVKELIETTIINFKLFNSVIDFKTANVQEKILLQKDTSTLLEKNKHILSTPELSKLFSEMLILIKEFSTKTNESLTVELKAEIVWPFQV